MSGYDGAWFAANLGVAKGNPPGDFYAECPLCGSSDNLHITDQPDGAEAFCFSPDCGASTGQVIAAIESPTTPTVTRLKRQGADEPRDRKAEADPLRWWADHCGVPESFLAYLPVAAQDGNLVYQFDDMAVIKRRRAGSKSFSWDPKGAATPPLWPIPALSMPETMILVEGEADATVVAFHVVQSSLDGLIAVHSVSGGAGTDVPVPVWRELARRGLRTVLVIFDEDKAGEKGADLQIGRATQAGLIAQQVHVEGIDLLRGEKDARDVWLRKIARDPDADVDLSLAEPTLDDLGAKVLTAVDGAPPPDLIEGFLDPEGHTILYGRGDSGKGVLASYYVAALTRRGRRVVIADFEHHANEWRRRIAGHGGNTDLVAMFEPVGALWEVSDEIAGIASAFGAEFLVIDSISVAALGAGESDPFNPEIPVRYANALRRIDLVALSLAHVTKRDANPEYPFGSVNWHNQARTTWSLDDTGSGRVLEHRKRGNRPWQGRLDVAIEFDDAAGVITTTVTQQDGATPTVTRSTPESREHAALAALRTAAAPIPEHEAVSKTDLAKRLGMGKQAALDLIDKAVAMGFVSTTPVVLKGGSTVVRYWSGSGSGTGSEPRNHYPDTGTPSASEGTGSGSTPREPEPEPVGSPAIRGQRGER